MRQKWVLALSICLLLVLGVQQAVMAQGLTPTKAIPIISKGFGAKLSPDGKTLITFENVVLLNLDAVEPTLLPMKVIDISTGEQRGQLDGYSDYVSDAAFTRDGRKMVSVHQNGDVYVWNMATLKVSKSFVTPFLGALQVKMFPDNKRLLVVAAGIPTRVVVMDIESGAITKTLGKHYDSFTEFKNTYVQMPGMGDVTLAAFTLSPDGKLVATATASDEVQLWSVADNQAQQVRQKSEKPALFNIRQMEFTPDGKSLVYFDFSDKQTHIWNLANQSDTPVALGSDIFALSPDGKTIAWLTRVNDSSDMLSIAPMDAPDKMTVLYTFPSELDVAPRISWIWFTSKGKQLVVGGFHSSDETQNQIMVFDVPSK